MVGIVQPGQKVIFRSIVDDWMVIFPLKGVGGENLRSISLKIYGQKHINDKDLEGIYGFEFKIHYKYNISCHSRTLFFLRNCLSDFVL